MFNKKIIVSADKITRVLYENSCVTAKGGRKVKRPTARMERTGAIKPLQDDTSAYTNLFAPSETEPVGLYHTKNYRQRKKIRKKAVAELVQNNFDPNNCLFITLHFDAKTYIVESSTEEESNTADEFQLPKGLFDPIIDLVALSNELFSSPNQSTNPKPADVEPKLTITNEGYQNLDICYSEFKKFIKKMNYRYTDFKYVAVFDRQNNTGNWHYHLICNLNYFNFEELKKIWSVGGFYIRQIKTKSALEKVTKYLEKNMTSACGSLRYEKGYYASRGLNRNKVFRLWKDEEVVEYNKYDQVVKQAISNGLKPTMHISEHTYMGKVEIDDTFEDKEERICRVEYYSYWIDSSNDFAKTMAKKTDKDSKKKKHP